MDNVKFLTHQFNITLYHTYFADGTVALVVHGNNQFMLQDMVSKYLRSDRNDTSIAVSLQVVVKKIEVLRRRNRSKQSCNPDWMNWDQHFIAKYAEEIGCTPSYLDPHENIPICGNQMQMKKWYDFLPNLKNKKDNVPCQEMPRIDYDISDTFGTLRTDGIFKITTTYPQQAKIITQTRAVDYQALIGNIGGYIGLFLGTI